MWDVLYQYIQMVWGYVQWLYHEFGQWFQWIWDHLEVLGKWLESFYMAVGHAFEFAWNWIARGLRVVWRGFSALGHLKFGQIWSAIKRGYERFRKWVDWYIDNFQKPIEQIRARIWEIYNRFFKPIIRFLDSLRVLTRAIGIFNRKLAAKLDARLWLLESRILWPITQMLKRVNELSGWMRAYITRLGYLDRTLQLESLRRDALLVWEVLTNPRARLFAPGETARSYTYSDLHSDVQVYGATKTGPIADYIDEAHRSVREDFLGVI